jgi:hypothetical protein
MLADVNGMPAGIESAGAEAPLTSRHHSDKGMQRSEAVHLVDGSEDGPAGPPDMGEECPLPPELPGGADREQERQQ